jgi:recombination protein RecT
MSQSVSNAVATQDRATLNLVPQYRAEFSEVLPSHIKSDTFVRLAQAALRKNDDLRKAADANPASFIFALRECARLGHVPGSEQYALVVFNNNNTGVPEVVGIEQYQGEIERMYRAGAAASIKCEIVRENDVFRWSPTTMRVPIHEYDPLAPERERGQLRGVYAFAEMHGGATSQIVVLGRDEVMRHKAVARSKKFWEGPWEPSMWKKTAIHELEKWIPTSSEFMAERLRIAQKVAAESPRTVPLPAHPTPERAEPHVDVVTGEVVDGEIVEPAGWAS